MTRRWTVALTIVATAALFGIVTPPVLPGAAKLPVVRVSDGSLQERWTQSGSLRAVRVEDPGIPPGVWGDVRDPVIAFRPAAPASGITYLDWPLRLTLGQVLRVEGYADVNDASVVRLTGPLGVEEVDARVAPEAGAFAFSLPIGVAGRHVVSLSLETVAGDRVDNGRLPVSVEAPKPLRVWTRASSPSFEWQALARWIGKGAGEVTMQTLIAIGREQITTINRADDDTPTLAQTDVLLMDGRTWERLDAEEYERLAQAVNDGLGVVVLADESTVNATDRSADHHLSLPPFRARAANEDEAIGVEAWAASLGIDELPALRASAVVLEGAPDGDLPRSDSGEALVAVERHGGGAIALVAVQETYRWRTAGFDRAHAEFWRRVLERVARTDEAPRLHTPRWAQVDRRVALCIEGASDERLVISTPEGAGDDTVAVGTHETGARCGYYWPRSTGWHTVRGEAAHAEFFVEDAEAWSTLHARRARDASWAVGESSRAALAHVPLPSRRVPGPLMLLVFVTAAGLLWWQETAVTKGVSEQRR